MKIGILVLGLSLAIVPTLYAQNMGTSNATTTQTPSALHNDVIYGTGLTADELRQLQYSDQEIAQLRTDGQVLIAQTKVAPPPSDAGTSSANQGAVIPGTGLTPAELKKWNYSDQEIAQLRNDGETLMAQNSATPGTASGNSDQSPTAATASSQNDSNRQSNGTTGGDQQQASADRTGLWGLLGLLGLLGLAGRGRRREVVRQDVDVIDRDRVVERDRDRRIA